MDRIRVDNKDHNLLRKLKPTSTLALCRRAQVPLIDITMFQPGPGDSPQCHTGVWVVGSAPWRFGVISPCKKGHPNRCSPHSTWHCHGTSPRHFLTSKQDSWAAEQGQPCVGDTRFLRWRTETMLKTRDPFQDKRKAGCLIQKGGMRGFPRPATRPWGLLEALLGSLSSSSQVQGAACLLGAVAWSGKPQPQTFSNSSLNSTHSGQIALCTHSSSWELRASEVSACLQDIWDLLQAGLCGKDVVQVSPATSENGTEYWVHLLLDFYQKDLKA